MVFITLIILIFEVIVYSWLQNNYLLKSVTDYHRGTETERKLVLKLLKSGIHFQTIFHDLYITNANGSYSQIDLVVPTKVGIIVFEVKKYSGWIFGNGNQPKWTQLLAYGKQRYRFYSPVFQNNKHILDLKKQLPQFENIPFYSVLVFYGDCVFKDISFIPNGTFIVKQHNVLKVIKNITNENEPANYINKREILNLLKNAVKNGENKDITNKHIANIKNRLGEHRIYD